ncbi:pilus assembly protein PilM [Ectothiorhodospiraceae bacterium WFHF3C12]|nr:pilus assembly protein PilM [Ectothiorhodospiraceae bacterium WFHF3C12]
MAGVRRGGEMPCLEYLAQDGRDDTQQLGEQLRALTGSLDIGGRRAVMALPHTAYQLLQIEAPDVDPAELRAAVRWRIKDLIDYHVEDAVVDVIDVPQPEGRSGGHSMYALAARRNDVRAYADAAEGAGLDVEAVDVAEMALRNIAELAPEQGGGLAVAALAARGGLIVISRGETLYLARHLEYGAEGLTSEPEVYGDSLALEMQRSLDYYESQLSAAPASRVLLAPFGSDRSAVLDMLQEQLPVPCAGLSVDQVMDIAEGVEHPADYATLLALGAALRQEQRSL